MFYWSGNIISISDNKAVTWRPFCFSCSYSVVSLSSWHSVANFLYFETPAFRNNYWSTKSLFSNSKRWDIHSKALSKSRSHESAFHMFLSPENLAKIKSYMRNSKARKTIIKVAIYSITCDLWAYVSFYLQKENCFETLISWLRDLAADHSVKRGPRCEFVDKWTPLTMPWCVCWYVLLSAYCL